MFLISIEDQPRVRNSISDWLRAFQYCNYEVVLLEIEVSTVMIVSKWFKCGLTLSIHPSVGDFIETHLRKEVVETVINSVVPGWRFESNHIKISGGRILLVWDSAISVLVLLTDQIMLCSVLIQFCCFLLRLQRLFREEFQARKAWRFFDTAQEIFFFFFFLSNCSGDIL